MRANKAAAWAGVFCFGLVGIFFVLLAALNLVTVRLLRRLPEMRGRLGFDPLPGSHALNVAVALSWPRRLMQLLDTSLMSWYFAHADSLYRYTSKGERWLARACYAAQMLSILGLLLAVALQRWA